MRQRLTQRIRRTLRGWIAPSLLTLILERTLERLFGDIVWQATTYIAISAAVLLLSILVVVVLEVVLWFTLWHVAMTILIVLLSAARGALADVLDEIRDNDEFRYRSRRAALTGHFLETVLWGSSFALALITFGVSGSGYLFLVAVPFVGSFIGYSVGVERTLPLAQHLYRIDAGGR